MKFRPCIDIHNGQVKQIVGGSLQDQNDAATENFVSGQDAAYYARLYRKYHITGGHIILLNPVSSPYYAATKEQALMALKEYPGGLQVGGGITDENASAYLAAGASHVIVTSFVFRDGEINKENLLKIRNAAGKEHLVLDVSCRKKGDDYYIVTDRWQKFTNVTVTQNVFYELAEYCDEFLIHAVDVEGKANGIEEGIASLIGQTEGIKVTYAGGISSFHDLDRLKELSHGKIDFTVGSALELFGGSMPFSDVAAYH